MKKIVLTYGIISGIIAGGMLFVTSAIMNAKGDAGFDNGMWLGFTTMILAFILIYFAQASYRKNIGEGRISYGKAFQIGILITIIASLCYVISWMFIYAYIAPDFMEKYQAYQLNKMQESGMSADKIAAMKPQMDESARMYKTNALYRAGLTFLEIFPVGLLITIISSFIVRIKRKMQPADLA